MTVAELIAELQKLPQDLEVFAADRWAYTRVSKVKVRPVLVEPQPDEDGEENITFGIEGEKGAITGVVL